MGNCCFESKEYEDYHKAQPLLAYPGNNQGVANVDKQGSNLFALIDTNKSGGISIEELRHALTRISIQHALGWPSNRYQALFDLLDPKGSGNIQQAVLKKYCKVRHLFQLIDVSKNHQISAWELETALRDNSLIKKEFNRLPPNLAPSLFAQIDTDQNGQISIVEFYRYCTQSAQESKTPYQSPENWEAMALRLLNKMDVDRSGAISLSELASALRCDRSVQLELGWPAHRAADLFLFLDSDKSGSVSLQNLRAFCRLRWLFNKIDANRSGYIDNYEFGAALNNPYMQKELNCSVSQAQALWRTLDASGTNSVGFEAFFSFFQSRLLPSTAGTYIAEEPKYSKPGDQYAIVRKIGEGGFGSVFLIKRKSDNLELIMKKPKLDVGLTMEDVKQEASLMQRLKHQHIVRLIEQYDEGGAWIIITEYCAGGDLRQRLKSGPIPQPDVKRIFRDSLEGLKYIHARRIIHRDLKPDNILLTAGGTAKIADLGLATQLKATAVQAQTQCGTPVYMAPEVLSDEPYDFKADMWSMGCILYELCTAKLTFTNPGAVLHVCFGLLFVY